MIRRSLNLMQLWLYVAHTLPVPLAFMTAYFLRFHSGLIPIQGEGASREVYLVFFALAMILWLPIVSYFHLRDKDVIGSMARGSQRAFLAVFVLVAVGSVLAFLFKQHFSRIFLVLFAVLLLFLLLLGQWAVERSLWRLRARGKVWRVLIVGTDLLAKKVAQRLSTMPQFSCEVVTLSEVAGAGAGGGEGSIPANVDEVIRRSREADEILVSIPLEDLPAFGPVLARLRNLEIPVRMVLDMDGLCNAASVFSFAGLLVADADEYPAERLSHVILKRAFDIVFSFLFLLVFSPLYLLVGLAVWLTMGWPVIYVQERVGLNGKLFRMYKFRSMKTASAQKENTEWSDSANPRVTPLGRFMRKFHLDELPQFYNVLNGDMTVVGPRPEQPHFVNEFSKKFKQYPRRHHFKAGITGWAQINGLIQDSQIDERLKYDLEYIQKWSLWFDIRIIVLTLLRSFTGFQSY